MWVFGYGSLMGDGWEKELGCLRRSVAALPGYRRTFDKASVRNWGTKEAPCPTLNLERDEAGACTGIAFQFTADREGEVRDYLRNREGKDFFLEDLTVRLDDKVEVQASVPVYRGENLVSTGTVQGKAVMVRNAEGMKGSCADYVQKIAELLASLGIDDPAVSELWQSLRKESQSSLMNEVRGQLELLESVLPRHVDAMAVSPTTKVPFKALLYREVLIWRMAELSHGALENFENDKNVSAIILTRAAVETSAALWYLRTKLAGTVQAGTAGDIDDYLMRLNMGSKIDPALRPAVNVLTFVDCVDRDIVGFRHQYDVLSEFAHPNWAGTALLYSKSNPVNLRTDFGTNIRGGDNTKDIGVLNLSVALTMFERNYNSISDLMPAFIALCENCFNTGKSVSPPET